MAHQRKPDPAPNSGGGYISNVVMDSGTGDDWYSVPSSSNDISSGPVGVAPPPQQIYQQEIEDYDNEPPLLEELGIHFDQILKKTLLVMNPMKEIDYSGFQDSADLAGPLVFCLGFGFCLLFAGKVHFGYVYGFSLFGCFACYLVLNLLSADSRHIDIIKVASVLGYCLLPIIGLATLGILFNLTGYFGLFLAIFTITWCTYSSTRLFEQYLSMEQQRWLIAYPIGLLYACFVLITIF
mmetsp:Transcript_28421/g.37159  ORF Transcript_28421/g.37159 Transcript_28421/m.37159 type:complete len:238 (+) Transcript_28421:56-769(+)